MEIGPFPEQDETCTMWKTTYSENGQVVSIKDYRLCRGFGEGDLFIDEGNGVKLASRWIGDVLITPFRYDRLLLISMTRLDGRALQEEILTVDDSVSNVGIESLHSRSIQRLMFERSPVH